MVPFDIEILLTPTDAIPSPLPDAVQVEKAPLPLFVQLFAPVIANPLRSMLTLSDVMEMTVVLASRCVRFDVNR